MAEPAVLLISPGILRWQDVDFGVPHLVSLGGYLRHHLGVRVEIVDLNYEGGDIRDLERRLDELGPFHVIGVSAYSSFDLLRVLSLARFLRERYPGVPLVTGGYHASALPADLLGAFDVVIPGEAEVELADVVQTVLGGGEVAPGIAQQRVVQKLDDLPPYAWDLLDRYWPHATQIGRKLQVYLSRGCPYRCAFCMERSKSGYAWRAYSPERALDELQRLSRFTDLSQWTINVADPLFGFKRRWRREVLEGIAARGVRPLQFWTLTRSDDLDDEDVRLLADARFAIGIGLESGSPRMLQIMQKGNTAEKYLNAVLGLARRSQRHGLNWAVNVIVGHPGETPQTAAETLAFVKRLFLEGPSSRGWVSIDPFRLYPGSQVHEQQAHYETTYGARFHHPEWWTSWYDGPFRAQHNDPSSQMDYEARVRWMFDQYGPVVRQIHERFEGPEGRVGRIFANSQLAEIDMLRPEVRDVMLARAQRKDTSPRGGALAVPIGLDVRDPAARRLEEALRHRLDRGMVVSDALQQALFAAPPQRFLPEAEAVAMVQGRALAAEPEGALPWTTSLSTLLMGLQAAAPGPGERVVDLGARSGHVAALLAELVGPRGEVLAVAETEADGARLREELADWPTVEVVVRGPAGRFDLPGRFDVAWLGAVLPRVPAELTGLLAEGGRLITAVGPRFRDQDLVWVGPDRVERVLARVRMSVLGGRHGWVPAPPRDEPETVRVVRAEGPALLFATLAQVDVGPDVAAVGPGGSDAPWARRIAAAWGEGDRLGVQMLGLVHERVHDLLQALRGGDALWQAVADGMEALRPGFAPTWTASTPWVEELQRLRAALYAPTGRKAPPLVVLDVPALGRKGRATAHRGVRRVATSLSEPADHVLMQIFHEEIHPVTDPVVLSELGDAPSRDTRPGTEGFAVHQQLEATAVAASRAFLTARAPEHVEAFEAWCRA